MQVTDIENEEIVGAIASTVEEDTVAVTQVQAVDITFINMEGEEIEPAAPISVAMTLLEAETHQDAVVVHVDNEGNAAVVEQEEESIGDDTSVTFTADSFSIYAVVFTETIETHFIAADGETYKITVSYGPEAHIPAGATLSATEITADGEKYQQYMTSAAAVLPKDESIRMARFFDITIMSAEGEEVHPDAPVSVEVTLDETPNENDTTRAVHFADNGIIEVLNAEQTKENVTFEAESFSVYGVVYTVDFAYEIDGVEYSYSITGGSGTVLSKLLPIVKLAADDPKTEEDELWAFIENTEDVAFSSPELV